jgi:hypothetical protein
MPVAVASMVRGGTRVKRILLGMAPAFCVDPLLRADHVQPIFGGQMPSSLRRLSRSLLGHSGAGLSRALTCPACRERGSIGGHGGLFEIRGQTEDELQIVRCAACLSGIVIHERRALSRRGGRLIDPEEWTRMELAWDREKPLPFTAATAALHDPATLVRDLHRDGTPRETLEHLVAEALSLPPDEARELISGVLGAA